MPLPLVSISCITFNHAPYIRDALEGFLMQRTSFPIEILIHDDASTDGTADILREYQGKHPDLILPVYQSENQYSRGVRGINARFNFSRARGKYIAICEGDDYWTDPLKLQKQVDFLENNPEYVMCYHDAIIVDEQGAVINPSKMPDDRKRDYTSDEIIRGRTNILTLSLVFRNVAAIRDYPPEAYHVQNGDNFLTSILGNYGRGKYMPEVEPAVYRVHEGGIWSQKSDDERVISKITTYYWLSRYYARLNKPEYENGFLTNIMNILKLNIHTVQQKPHGAMIDPTYKGFLHAAKAVVLMIANILLRYSKKLIDGLQRT